MSNKPVPQLGKFVLFGSGETLASSGKAHEYTARQLGEAPRMTILETPAGFEPNSDKVAGKIKTFLERRLQNYKPEISVLPARKRGTPFSPDAQEVVEPILSANWILLGPGSPTYGARQLRGSLAVEMMAARQQLGATVMLSSSSTLAFSSYTMPVYEVYKVGEDLHWKRGVDFFSRYGVSLVLIPHWDNNDGGDELDTSRCYMGRARFNKLRAMLPEGQTILGIDEHTAVIIDLNENCCRVIGNGAIYVLPEGVPVSEAKVFKEGDEFPASEIGQWQVPALGEGIAPDVWQVALAKQAELEKAAETPEPTQDVLTLVAQRATARANKNWGEADRLRDQLADLGWQVMDTPEGAQLEPL